MSSKSDCIIEIENHKKYKIFENTLNVLKDNYLEFTKVIETTKKNNARNLKPYSRAINKTIHNFAASIGTCVERSRRFTREYTNKQFQDQCCSKIKELFFSPECRFADNLRNFLLHYELPRICWIFGNNSIKEILFQKDNFNKYQSWEPEAKIFLDSRPESVDIIKAITSYYEAFCNYYDKWFYVYILEAMREKK